MGTERTGCMRQLTNEAFIWNNKTGKGKDTELHIKVGGIYPIKAEVPS